MMTCPSARASGSLMVRAMISAAPPGANPTTRRTGLLGKPWANAAAPVQASARNANAILISIPSSCEPPLSAAVVFYVPEAPARARGDPEVELLHVLVRRELRRRPVHDDPAVLQNIAVVGVPQRHARVLLGEQEADPLLPVEVLHDSEDLLDDLRRESERGLVEQDHARPRHERAPQRRHLLLSARGVPREARAALPESREVRVHALEIPRKVGATHGARVRAGKEILLDRQVREA